MVVIHEISLQYGNPLPLVMHYCVWSGSVNGSS